MKPSPKAIAATALSVLVIGAVITCRLIFSGPELPLIQYEELVLPEPPDTAVEESGAAFLEEKELSPPLVPPTGAPPVEERADVGTPSARLAGEVWEALKIDDSVERDRSLNRLLEEWVRHDPSAAAALSVEIENPVEREDYRRRVLHLWAGIDSAKAASWADAIIDTDERDVALRQVCQATSHVDPAESIRLAQQYELDQNEGEFLAELAMIWGQDDLTAAHSWAREEAAGAPRDAAMSRIAYVMAQSSPADAARVVMTEIPAGQTRNEAIISVLHQWIQTDPEAALQWTDEVSGEGRYLYDRALNEFEGYLDHEATRLK